MEGHSWEGVLARHEDLVQKGWSFEPMRDFVKAITLSPYASLIYPVASMMDLQLYGYSPFHMYREVVYVSYSPQQQQFRFAYHEHPKSAPTWERVCSVGESKDVFERLVVQKLKWVAVAYRRARAAEFDQAGFSWTF
jgi:hypothetical protein